MKLYKNNVFYTFFFHDIWLQFNWVFKKLANSSMQAIIIFCIIYILTAATQNLNYNSWAKCYKICIGIVAIGLIYWLIYLIITFIEDLYNCYIIKRNHEIVMAVLKKAHDEENKKYETSEK